MKPVEFNKIIEESKDGIVIPCILNGENLAYKTLDFLPYDKGTLKDGFSKLQQKIVLQTKEIKQLKEQITALSKENTELKDFINEYKSLNGNTEDLLLKTIESINVRVSELEVQMDEASNKIKYL